MLNFLPKKAKISQRLVALQSLNIYKQQFYMKFLHPKLAILGLLWSIVTSVLHGKAIAGVHSKLLSPTSQHDHAANQPSLLLNKGWTTFENSLGAFSIILPNIPTSKSFKNNLLPPYEDDITGLQTHLFRSEDPAGNVYVIRYTDLPAGKEFTDIDTFFKENLRSLWGGVEPNQLKFIDLNMNISLQIYINHHHFSLYHIYHE